MTKFACVLACILVAIDCFGKGLGDVPQTLFSDGARWLWYVVAVGWLSNALSAYFNLEEK